jgi:DNA-binding CsgD family transcriptional regulator
MQGLHQLTSVSQLLNDSKMYGNFVDFCNLLPGFFAVYNTNSETIVMNDAALIFADLPSLDAIINFKYDHYCTNACELADRFIAQDQKVLSRQSKTKLLTWMQGGKVNDWYMVLGEKKPIYNVNGNIIGISAYFTDVTDLLLKPFNRFLTTYELDKYHVLKNQFETEISALYDDLSLTSKESEVFFFLLRGKTSKEIAELLNLSFRTVESYTEKIKYRLGCSTKSQLIERGIAAGYLGVLPETLFYQFHQKNIKK